MKTKIKNLQQLYRDLDLLEQDLKAVNADLREVREYKRKLWIELEKINLLKH
jgi:prefoldin subunit 5